MIEVNLFNSEFREFKEFREFREFRELVKALSHSTIAILFRLTKFPKLYLLYYHLQTTINTDTATHIAKSNI